MPDMRKWNTMLRGALGVSLLLAASGAFAQSDGHSFFTAGWNSGGPAVYDASFKQDWKLQSRDELSDGWVLPDGGVVYSFSRRKEGLAGVVRLDENKELLWEYLVPKGHDNHSCQPLPHGGFLLGECGPAALWMVEISAAGKELKRIKVADSPVDVHHAFRMVRKTPQNTYLGTLIRPAKYEGETLKGARAYEWDASGKLLRTFPSGFFLAVRLPNGNTLVSEGHGRGKDGTLVTEYAPDDSVVWEFGSQDLVEAGLSVHMVCGFHRLSNGNLVVSNVKHGKNPRGLVGGESPKAFEVTPDKSVVWKIPEGASPHNMGSIQILDDVGDAHAYEVLR